MSYDYMEAMKQDIREYLEDRNSYDIDFSDYADAKEFAEDMNDKLWTEDAVTGNASGSYTFNRAEAEEYVKDNLELCSEAMREFCTPAEEVAEHFLNDDYEYFDVSIRCYLLSQAILEVAEELEDAGAFDAEEEEEE